MLLCDGILEDGSQCEVACHTYCCTPPLPKAPEGDWYCVACERRRRLSGKVTGPGDWGKGTAKSGSEKSGGGGGGGSAAARSAAAAAEAAAAAAAAAAKAAAAKEKVAAAKDKAAAAKAAKENGGGGGGGDGGGGAVPGGGSGGGGGGREEVPLSAAERLAAAQAAAALCEQLEEAMEALMGVDQFSDGAAVRRQQPPQAQPHHHHLPLHPHPPPTLHPPPSTLSPSPTTQVLLEVLDLLSGGGQGAAAVATPDCQRSLTGALCRSPPHHLTTPPLHPHHPLQVCKRLSEKLQSEKSLLPKLLKAVREGLREATRKVGSGGGGETFLEKETIAGLTAFKVRVCTTAAAHAFSTSHTLSLSHALPFPFLLSLSLSSHTHTHRTN